ncbi:hypothetical protein SSX86_031546 [Deinandra increscens subsp. villosa]|uniref:non-specific serine/threonine protein kinase n=1 Tax=Deinandra increscens subsp. villosa TaxID=3103831 RepID=A0AAP0GIL8_9ASTR
MTYSLDEISSATDYFGNSSLITESALGKVYKGRLLRKGILIKFTVRRLDCTYGLGDGLRTEISMIRRLRNKNIVSVHGFCDENNEEIIIYNYRQTFHGTLDQHLSDPTLTWSKRLQICLGVAQALNHIHYDVMHCDINSSKIFLNKHWEPKIYGFELSTEYPQSWRHRLLFSRYFDNNNMTPKYDVYSFGVLLLEVLCGRRLVIINDIVDREELDKIIDPNLRKQMDTESLRHYKDLAYECLNQQPEQRPTMDLIVKELDVVSELQWSYVEMEHAIGADEGTSSNMLKMDLLMIPLNEIKLATNNFDYKYHVGSGGYGIVYKAKLDVLNIPSFSSMEGKCKDELSKINKTVAIKRILSRADEQGKQGFSTEIQLLTCCKHPNVVSLLGFSREAREMILVYEYAFKGSLSDYLGNTRDTRAVNLTWSQRLQICLDIAHGINYLHTKMEGKPRIIHRDIKSENILLDENLNAKIADFGLSKFHPVNQQASTIYTKNLAGTRVYMDPEYLTTSKYKPESDVYSFGVVLFEVLSGRVAYDSIYTDENEMGLAPVARRRFNEGTLKELIDPIIIEGDDDHTFTLNRGPNQHSFDTFSKIADQCLAETQAKRPTMEVVIKELQNAINLQGDTMVLSRFRLSDIVLATKNFAKIYCLGLDTNGMVYKAELSHFGNNSLLATEGKNNGEPSKKCFTVAIKRITGGKSQQRKQVFFEELEMRTTYKHPNIVSPLGFCDEGDEMILVYEHASNRSLEDYWKSDDNMDNFTWTHRLKMCLKIAHGLHHLHTKMGNPHGDINSANILLYKNWEVKIAFFGISNPTNQDIGMKVYKDPEYETTHRSERKSDIYSFGVVLFEIFCGRLAYDQVYIKENHKGLALIARKCFDDGTIERIIDTRLKEETDEDSFTSNRGPNRDSLDAFLRIAYMCSGEAAKRPTMETVIKELETSLNFQETLVKNLQISLKDIKSATENFSEKNCIGSGRFWKLYKGELPFVQHNANVSRCTAIVAKRWDSKFGQGDHQFRKESNILFKCRHENIIRLVGYCNDMDEKIIAYEHMSNGSLDKYLKDANLTYMKRLKICIDVASGLEFLHQGDVTLKKLLHKDIRSASILLNDDWKAKISNLELSSLDTLHKDTGDVSENANATSGYLDPQYKQGFLTEKSDMYSFGVVLFEVLCGRLAWIEDCKDHSQSLGPLAKRCHEEAKLDEMVFEGIKDQICPESLAAVADIAYQCLHDKGDERPTACQVVLQLKKSLDDQEEYELWGAQLPENYKEIIQMSKTPDIYSTAKRKYLYDTLSKGILNQEGTRWFSLGSNGAINEMISASQFSYQDHGSHQWRSVPESRFDKIAEMLDILNLNIQIKMRSRFITSGVNYGIHLVFKFCGARKVVAKRMYVNLTYKMGDETLHAYFATWRKDEWMMIELFRFLNHKESDTTDFEFLLESFCCEDSAIYVEGIEFRAIDNASFTNLLICSFVKPEENNSMEVQQNTDLMQQLQTNDIPSDTYGVEAISKLFGWRNNKNQYYMLSAKEAFSDPFNAGILNLKRSTEFRFHMVAELLSTQVFHINCNIESKILLQNKEYGCYLVFKLSEKCFELYCPVMVEDLREHDNNRPKVVYFRSPRPWNIDDVDRVPQEREDGWMEVYMWNFKPDQNNFISVYMIFTSYEGTMSGLIVRGLEFRPM